MMKEEKKVKTDKTEMDFTNHHFPLPFMEECEEYLKTRFTKEEIHSLCQNECAEHCRTKNKT